MDWNQLREQFPVTRQWAYLDHAAVSALSVPADKAYREWSQDRLDHGYLHESAWLRCVEEVRKLAAALIRSPHPEDIAFVKNTSEGVGIVAEGYPWQPGDNVVITQDEYPANVYPWMNLVSRGVEVRTVPGRSGRILLEDLASNIDGRTRVLSISHVEYATGFRNDLDVLGELCRQRNVLFCVDAIQSVGALNVDVERSGIDFLSADGHKWMLGPEGAGIFYVRRSAIERLHPVGIGWNSVVGARDFGKIDFRLKPDAGRWESGSLNVGGIVAMGASLEILTRIGIEAIEGRLLQLTDYLCEKAQRLDLEVFSSREAREKSAIVTLIKNGTPLPAVVRKCREQQIVVSQRGGRLRLSPHFYNTTEEIDRALEVIAHA